MPACPAPVVSGTTATVTCGYTGGSQYWTVPAGVLQATFTLYGAAGSGGGGPVGPGGSGAEVTGTLPVTPGTALQVNVGQAGGPFGGGGASDIRDGTDTLADRLLVAGGGGGGGANGSSTSGLSAAGGAGGNAGSPGGTGTSTSAICYETESGGGGGGAGTATMGGAGGAGGTSGASCAGNTTPPNGAAGSEGNGGAGGSSANGTPGGGGGGGYYGGGGGGGGGWDSESSAGGGGGGGGSSFTGTATDASVNDDPASPPPGGNGEVIITYHPVLTVTDHRLAGQETALSCLTATRCVAVGSRGLRGVVVTLTNGAQSHAAALGGSPVLSSVSCPSTSGCWAIGRPVRGAGAYLVKISSAGRPEAERTVALPAGTTLGVISCASMTSCQVAGTDNHLRPAAIETGTWNGTRLRLYRVRVTGSTQVSMTDISCWHSDCEAVGSALVGSADTDLIVTTSGGRPDTPNTDSGYALSSISCVSATTCYAAGAAVLVTVTSGAAADPQAVTGWNGNAIECTESHCEAAGGEVFGAAYADALVSLTDGTAGTPVIVQTGQGYSGIATRGSSGFIAIGAGSSSGSEDTVG